VAGVRFPTYYCELTARCWSLGSLASPTCDTASAYFDAATAGSTNSANAAVYRAALQEIGRRSSPQPPPLDSGNFLVGDPVLIYGLESALGQSLSGRMGVVHQAVATGRVPVCVEGVGVKLVRPDHLQPIGLAAEVAERHSEGSNSPSTFSPAPKRRPAKRRIRRARPSLLSYAKSVYAATAVCSGASISVSCHAPCSSGYNSTLRTSQWVPSLLTWIPAESSTSERDAALDIMQDIMLCGWKCSNAAPVHIHCGGVVAGEAISAPYITTTERDASPDIVPDITLRGWKYSFQLDEDNVLCISLSDAAVRFGPAQVYTCAPSASTQDNSCVACLPVLAQDFDISASAATSASCRGVILTEESRAVWPVGELPPLGPNEEQLLMFVTQPTAVALTDAGFVYVVSSSGVVITHAMQRISTPQRRTSYRDSYSTEGRCVLWPEGELPPPGPNVEQTAFSLRRIILVQFQRQPLRIFLCSGYLPSGAQTDLGYAHAILSSEVVNAHALQRIYTPQKRTSYRGPYSTEGSCALWLEGELPPPTRSWNAALCGLWVSSRPLGQMWSTC